MISKSGKPAPREQSGFTLLEILMALIFIALPLAAITQTISSYVGDAAYLRDKTIAHWVAMNKLTELQISRSWPSVSAKEDGDTLMAEQNWHWKYRVSKTPEADMRRIDIDVYTPGSKEDVITSLTTYIGKP